MNFKFFLLKKITFFFSVLIGLSVGISAIFFMYAIKIVTHLALEGLVGYFQPKPAGEGGNSETYIFIFNNPYIGYL